MLQSSFSKRTNFGSSVAGCFRMANFLLMLAVTPLIPAGDGMRQQDCGSAGARDLPTLWRSVDAVAYLRIREISDSRTRHTESDIASAGVEHEATVLEVFRRYRGTPATPQLKFLRIAENGEQQQGERTPGENSMLLSGEECIAFLHWNDAEEIFESVQVLPVRDGRVKSFCIDEILFPMKIEAFLVKLRSMQE